MPEFTAYSSDQKGSAEFQEVIARIEKDEILWPEKTTTAKTIWGILNDNTMTSPTALYQQLANIETRDLRPHLLMLLKGFNEDGNTYQISYTLFQTLHQWVEIRQSHLRNKDEIVYHRPEEGLRLLKLTLEQEQKFISAIDATRPLAERTIFCVRVDHQHAIEAVFGLFMELLNTRPNIEDYISLRANLAFLKKYIEVFSDASGTMETQRRLIANFINHTSPILDTITTDEKLKAKLPQPPYGMGRKHLVAIKESVLAFMAIVSPEYAKQVEMRADNSGETSIISSIILYGSHPLLSYQHEKDLQWFFPFLGPYLLSIYSAVTDQKYHAMFYCYGKISPKELIYRFLHQQPRLGNLVAFTDNEKDFEKQKIHDSTPEILADILFHDYLHQLTHTAVSFSSIENIVIHWIKLIGEKTKLTSTWNNESIPYSHETWSLTDFGFQYLFDTQNTEMRKFHKIFEVVFCHFANHHGVKYLLILDMLLNNFYIKLEEPKPALFQIFEQHRAEIMQAFNDLTAAHRGTALDPFILTSICIYSIINNNTPSLPVLFKSNTFKKYSKSIHYSWKKEKPDNIAELWIGTAATRQIFTLNTLTDAHLKATDTQKCAIS